MAYSTVDDLLLSYPRLTTTQVASATLYKWLDRASNYIDGYIGSAVPTIPVTPAPPILVNMCEDMAQVMFLRRHTHEGAKDVSLSNTWAEIVQRLENMRNGTILIYSGSGTIISLTTRNEVPWSNVSAYNPTFTMEEIEDMEVDSERILDEYSERE